MSNWRSLRSTGRVQLEVLTQHYLCPAGGHTICIKERSSDNHLSLNPQWSINRKYYHKQSSTPIETQAQCGAIQSVTVETHWLDWLKSPLLHGTFSLRVKQTTASTRQAYQHPLDLPINITSSLCAWCFCHTCSVYCTIKPAHAAKCCTHSQSCVSKMKPQSIELHLNLLTYLTISFMFTRVYPFSLITRWYGIDRYTHTHTHSSDKLPGIKLYMIQIYTSAAFTK